MPVDAPITTYQDLEELLDCFLAKRQGEWWTAFYEDRSRDCPFFVDCPDENLAELVESGRIMGGARVLELGCGNGRDAVYLSEHGCRVTAIDFSQTAIAWARERAAVLPNPPEFLCASIYGADVGEGEFDLVYDSGCFHHQPPHRRPAYLNLLRTALKPNGLFGLVCFTPDGGATLSDVQVYEERGLKGGLGYTEGQLRCVFERDFDILEFRRMRDTPEDSGCFGKGFLWTVLMRKKER